jgi:hypothetical protein
LDSNALRGNIIHQQPTRMINRIRSTNCAGVSFRSRLKRRESVRAFIPAVSAKASRVQSRLG